MIMNRNFTRFCALTLLAAAACPCALAGDQFALISAGSDWKYWDKTNYPGDVWRTLGFDDSGWSNGPAMLGFGDANGLLPRTTIASNGQWTAYFRQVFTVSNTAIYSNLLLSLQRDDGAVIWLNGKELWRNNMPTNGAILPNTPASTTVGGADESAWWTTNASPTNLVLGQNILAAEVHQINLTSSDLIFDFALEGLNNNARPVITVPSNPSLSEAPATLQLTATIRDDGNPLPADPANPDPHDPHKLRWSWSVVSVPAASSGIVWSGNPTNGEAFTYQGSPNPPNTVFTCSPTATFDVPGVYVLAFTAGDGEKEISGDVTVSVRATGDYRRLGYLYLSPVPDAEYVSAQTRYVLVRFSSVSPLDVTNLSSFIAVRGASSGQHTGVAHLAGDGRTVIYQMGQDFTANELVTITLTPLLRPGAAGTADPYQYQLRVTGPMSAAWLQPQAAPPKDQGPVPSPSDLGKGPGYAAVMPNGVSVPSDFPQINITVNNNPDPEYIFIDTRGGGGKPYNVIFDNSGSPIWYQLMPDERRDMKVQHNGLLTMLARTGGYRFVGLNTNYNEIASYWAVNGYSTDEHELQVLADGRYLLIGLRNNTVDMTRYLPGASTAASVGETIIQEFTPAGELIFQWRAWDNYDVRDLRLDNPYSTSFRFPHMNAIDIDLDGHILVSCRHLSEVTKINRDTGQIIWRLGGAHNQFNFLNDTLQGFENQHAIRVVGTNRYLLFDNGDLHSPPVSRGVEYELDLTNMTAKVVWQYPATPTTSLYSYYMGNTQRLPNGNTLINWAVGNLPKLTEVRPDGTKAFEMNWASGFEAYRVWRCSWQGLALKPNLLIEPYPDRITLLFNKFGDTNVSYYRIYGGTSPNPSSVLATSVSTLANLSNLQNQRTYYFRVTAVNRNGAESAFSDEKSVLVNIIKPGENMVLNGDFSQGTGSWTWTVSGTASAGWSILSGAAFIDITNAGNALTDVQLCQAGLKLLQGKEYVLAFDAWSASSRAIEVRLQQNQSPFTTYKLANPSLTTARRRFSYPFVMANATDLNTRLAFNLGVASADVYLDDIVLFMVAPGDFNRDQRVDLFDLSVFTGQWLQQGSGHTADFNGDSRVDFRDFSIFGQNWSGR